jgi:tight adherence protein B
VTGFLRRLGVVCLLGLALLGGVAGAAQAADDASIDHAEPSDGQLKLLVSVPGDAVVDLGSVSVTIDGKAVDASAQTAANTD